MAAENRAFDVTPAALVTAIVTEDGVFRAPYPQSLPILCGRPDEAGREKPAGSKKPAGTKKPAGG